MTKKLHSRKQELTFDEFIEMREQNIKEPGSFDIVQSEEDANDGCKVDRRLRSVAIFFFVQFMGIHNF